MLLRLISLVCLLLAVQGGSAQILDQVFPGGVKRVDIPFQLDNNFMIVEVKFNHAIPLRFIFDTGAEHTILTQRSITDILSVNYSRKFTILGSDLQTELYAYLARGVSMQLGPYIALNRNVLVLEEDYFRFEEYAGINVHGIIGADIFRRFVVQIDYRKRIISFYEPQKFKPPRGAEVYDLDISRGKPYMSADIHYGQDTIVPGKLLLDTGASLSLLLHANTHPQLRIPSASIQSNIGMGLGGFLEGFVARVDQLDIGSHKLQGVVTNFQDVLPTIDSSFLNGRNGILGLEILSRFHISIDYHQQKLYLKPNKDFKSKFVYDRSGLSIAWGGVATNRFTVFFVAPGSPAALAGLLPGDQLLSVNNIPTGVLSLNDINRRLRKKVGKRVKLKVLRGEEKRLFTFRLEELI